MDVVIRKSCVPIICSIIAITLWSTVVESITATENGEFGSLKLCPAGGPSFVYAWNLACEMKRKKRSTSAELIEKISGPNDIRRKRSSPEGYRPATFSEMMKICCDLGCEIRDLLAYCDPFGPWNSR